MSEKKSLSRKRRNGGGGGGERELGGDEWEEEFVKETKKWRMGINAEPWGPLLTTNKGLDSKFPCTIALLSEVRINH